MKKHMIYALVAISMPTFATYYECYRAQNTDYCEERMLEHDEKSTGTGIIIGFIASYAAGKALDHVWDRFKSENPHLVNRFNEFRAEYNRDRARRDEATRRYIMEDNARRAREKEEARLRRERDRNDRDWRRIDRRVRENASAGTTV